MDIADWLAAITKKCHLVTTPDQAIRLAPDLCVDGPPLWDLGEDAAGSGSRWAFPVACTAYLAPPVADVVASSLAAALDGQERESFAQHGVEEWAADPLVSKLARLLLEAALVSPEATGLPLLELMRISTGLLSGTQVAGAGRGASGSSIERSLGSLAGSDAQVRGEILGQVSWSLAARMGAAWGLAAQIRPSLRPTRFYQAMLRSKLSLVLQADRELPDLALVLGVLGVSADAALLGTLLAVCESGITELERRLDDGKSKPADRQFSASVLARCAIPSGVEARHRLLAHDPDVATAYLLRLSDFHNAKQLEKLGLDRKRAKQLLDPELAQAIAASLHDLLQALQLWDLLCGMVHLTQRAEDLTAPSWQRGLQSRLVVPRGDLGDTKAHVVAVRLGDIQARCFQEARTNDEPLVPLALERLIGDLIDQQRSAGAAIFTIGSHLICLQPSASAALTAATAIAEAVTPPQKLELAPLRQPSSLPRGPAVGIGLSFGTVHGGFDGYRWLLRGPAIEQAIALTGYDAPHGKLGDPLGVRHVALGASGLLSQGMVATPDFSEQLQGEAKRQGSRYMLPDSGQPVAGVRKPFMAYPIVGVRESADRSVTILVRLDGEDKDSPVEIIQMGIDAFQEFHGHEQGLSPDACRGLVAGGGGLQPNHVVPQASSHPAAAHSDPFGEPTADDSSSDFDFEVEENEEYEFEIEDVPYQPPPSQAAPVEESNPFEIEDFEIEDFDEGVLVLDDGPSLSPEADPLAGLGGDSDGFEIEDDPGDASPFAFDSEASFDSDAAFATDGGDDPLSTDGSDDAYTTEGDDVFASGSDDLFSFEDDGLDEDPFAESEAGPAPPASISLSGETSLDAFSTDPEEEPLDPSLAGAQTDDDAIPLGYLPPADISTTSDPSPDAQDGQHDDAIPLGYLPPAPTEAGDTDSVVHEVRLPSRDKSPPPANPTLMPEDLWQQPAAPSPHPDKEQRQEQTQEQEQPPNLPSMPASLLALIGEDEPKVPESAGDGGLGGEFQLVSADQPEAQQPEPAPASEPLEVSDPTGDDPWGATDDEQDPHQPEEPVEEPPPGVFDIEDDDFDPFAPQGDAPQDDDPPGDVPLGEPPQEDAPRLDAQSLAADVDDAALPSDPLTEDDDAFESLFSGDEADTLGDGFEPELPSQGLDDAPTAPPELDDEPLEDPFDEPEDDEPLEDPFDEPEDVEPLEDPFGQPEDEDTLDGPFDEPEDEDTLDGPFDEPPLEDDFEVDPELDSLEDPFDIPDDDPVQPSAADKEPPPKGAGADGAKKIKSGKRSKTLPDFSFMFTGYVLYVTDNNSVLFGHRHGGHLLDVHEYPCGDDLPEAYRRFLADKISERFIPRADLSRPAPKHIEGRTLDMSLLQQAFTDLGD
jgi:hypothetical protein